MSDTNRINELIQDLCFFICIRFKKTTNTGSALKSQKIQSLDVGHLGLLCFYIINGKIGIFDISCL